MPAADATNTSTRHHASRPRLTGLVAGLLHGLLLALAFPPAGFYGFVLIAPLPLFWACWRGRDKPLVVAFWIGVGVMPWWGLAHIWITAVSALGFFPLAALLSGYTMLCAWCIARLLRRSLSWIWAVPLIWVGVEFLRGVALFHGYPWYLLAHPFADALVLAWPAAFIGTFGVSLLAAVPATAIIAWLSRKRTTVVAFAVSAVAWPLVGLFVNPWPTSSSVLKVAIIQTNVAQNRKIAWSAEQRYNDWQRMRDLIVHAAGLEPDVIVLPEAMTPGMTLDPASLRTETEEDLYWARESPDGVDERISATMLTEELLIYQRMLGIPILIGGAAYDNLDIVEREQGGFRYQSDARYNTVFVIEDGLPPTERYDKVMLTPFGETMPYISASPWLERQLLSFGAEGMQFDLAPGERLEPVSMHTPSGEQIQLATPICFEATMPWVCRRLVGTEPGVAAMINLTNDGWFGSWDPARLHHLLCARWRSIETGVAMVRCANTGISCVIDQRGKIISIGVLDPRTSEEVLSLGDGVRLVEVPIADGRTPYTRIGDIVGWICLVGCGILLGLTFTPIRPNNRSEDRSGEPERGEHRSGTSPKEHNA